MSVSPEKIFDRLLNYLSLLKRKIIRVDREHFVIMVEETVDNKKITIMIGLSPPFWVVMRAKLVDGSEIEKLGYSAYIVYREILRLSFRSAEFKFAMDDQKNIYITEDIHFAALTFDVFDEEYYAIPAAFKTFHEKIYPEIKEIVERERIEVA